ncbi:MAG: hypothetical protein EB829_04940, partial [Nitrosopumilus sp. H8]
MEEFLLNLSYLVVLASVAVVLLGGYEALAQDSGSAPADDTGVPPGLEITPADDAKSADELARLKFDDGFYSKIQNITDGQAQGEDSVRYYGVIIVVSRDNGDGADPDYAARHNKKEVARQLDLLGARNIVQADVLSFVTAHVPVDAIPQVSLMGEVYRIGDGEIKMAPTIDRAKSYTHSTPEDLFAASGLRGLNGSGVIVGVLDSLAYHDTAFGDRVLKQIKCPFSGCVEVSRAQIFASDRLGVIFGGHGTGVSQIIGASELSKNNGIAPGVSLIHVEGLGSAVSIPLGIDALLKEGADIVNMSFTSRTLQPSCNILRTVSSYSIIMNEAADRGLVMVAGSGNSGLSGGVVQYSTISAPACFYNIIAVGGLSTRDGSTAMYDGSSRGPILDKRLKPDLVAPAVVEKLSGTYGTDKNMIVGSGTSNAGPLVAGAAAILLQADPDLAPVDVRAALLLGATWMGPAECTSAGYERSDSSNGCSHAKQEPDRHLASSTPEALQTLNNVGLGALNTSNALRYVLEPAHIRSGHLASDSDTARYTFTVPEAGIQTKIILTWLRQSHGAISALDGVDRGAYTVANLDFVTLDPEGRQLGKASGRSSVQNTEFAVFTAPQAGTYTVIVSGTGMDEAGKRGQRFALASTHPLEGAPASNNPPVTHDRSVTIEPGSPIKILLAGTDPDGDSVSFYVDKGPRTDAVPQVIPAGANTSYIVHTPTGRPGDSFTVTPHDGTEEGAPVTITLVPESLPTGTVSDRSVMHVITDTDTLEIQPGSAQRGYSREFPGKDYPVTRLQLSSAGMIEPGAIIRTGSDTYTVAIPDGTRRVTFAGPVTIDSVMIFAKGIDTGFFQRQKTTSEGMYVSVGYKDVPTGDEDTPDIFLRGTNPHHVNPKTGAVYGDVDPGVICIDDAGSDGFRSDSNLTSIDTKTRFNVMYTCQDDRGNVNSTMRTVIVDDVVPTAPTRIGGKNKNLDTGDSFRPKGQCE